VSKKKKISDIYEVGYGKPPKNTQFQKGISGNPTGRPKKAPDFYAELIREANSLITINDKGRWIRITKTHGMAKQLTNQVVTGNIRATRIFVELYQEALERVALSATQQSSDSGKNDDIRNLTDEELMRIAAGGLKKTEEES
jgi:Family of unknown function (DUF5681)